ncbi:MAG: choice-of-anchor A family protein [Leptolyngbya sp. SIO1E4]|nr:choice-of-anchor A family protein [Leptolyngbya sp. SIO1E4]
MITTLAVATLPAIAQAPFLDLVDSAAFEEVDSASDVEIEVGAETPAFSLSTYNLVVFEDLSSNSEVEGSAFVGGDLNGSSASFCIKCAPSGSFAPLNGTGLKVVGDINGNPKQVNNGSGLEYGGTLNAIVNANGGGSKTQSSTLIGEFDELKTFLLNLSSQLVNLETNSEVVVPDQQPGAVQFNASGAEVAIFHIEADQLFSSKTQQIELNRNGSETIIINVGGESADWTQGNMVGALVDDAVQQNVIWHFYEAETLQFNNAFHGSLLAPFATLTNQTELEGTIVVESFEQRGEVHLPVFTGALPVLLDF